MDNKNSENTILISNEKAKIAMQRCQKQLQAIQAQQKTKKDEKTGLGGEHDSKEQC